MREWNFQSYWKQVPLSAKEYKITQGLNTISYISKNRIKVNWAIIYKTYNQYETLYSFFAKVQIK